MSKVLKLAGASVLALALVLGMAIPALAAPDSASWVGDLEGELLRGEVLSIGDQEFVIQSGEEELTIAVGEATLYYQLSVPGQVMASAQQRWQLRQQNQTELKARVGNGQGQGSQNRVRAAVSARHQARLQNQLAQTEGAPMPGLCFKGPCSFGGQAEFSDIAVGDSVVMVVDGNLARVVLIVKPTA